MTIYDIDRELLECVDETGEVIDLEKLVALQMERDQKCENIGCWIIDLVAEANAIKAQEEILKNRREIVERKAERLKTFLTNVLDGEPFKTPRCAVSFRKSMSVQIDNEAEIPDTFFTEKVTRTANKTAIRGAMREGIDVPGCSLVYNVNINVK